MTILPINVKTFRRDSRSHFQQLLDSICYSITAAGYSVLICPHGRWWLMVPIITSWLVVVQTKEWKPPQTPPLSGREKHRIETQMNKTPKTMNHKKNKTPTRTHTHMHAHLIIITIIVMPVCNHQFPWLIKTKHHHAMVSKDRPRSSITLKPGTISNYHSSSRRNIRQTNHIYVSSINTN